MLRINISAISFSLPRGIMGHVYVREKIRGCKNQGTCWLKSLFYTLSNIYDDMESFEMKKVNRPKKCIEGFQLQFMSLYQCYSSILA